MRLPSDAESCRTLTFQQVERLTDVVDTELQVPGRGNYPTLKMSVRMLVEAVRRRLDADDMAVNDIRINGGAARYILIGDDDHVRNYFLSYALVQKNCSRFRSFFRSVSFATSDNRPERCRTPIRHFNRKWKCFLHTCTKEWLGLRTNPPAEMNPKLPCYG